MTQVFDFEKFLAEMAKLDHADILTQAEAECGAAERASSGSEVKLHQRQLGNRYTHHVREFLFFMRYGARPPVLAIEFS
jgi:hypothetical protein